MFYQSEHNINDEDDNSDDDDNEDNGCGWLSSYQWFHMVIRD